MCITINANLHGDTDCKFHRLSQKQGYRENLFLPPVILFADYHAKTEVGDKYGTTALIWAARKGRIDIAQMLLRAGASVDAVGMYSWTPLLVAARWEGWMQRS